MRVAGAFSKQLRELIQSTVAVKGNKVAHGSKDQVSVIDLDSETFTTIDFQKKTYSVMTFAEMTKAMENAIQQMQGKTAQSDAKPEFKVSVKSTGATKQIAGYDAKELLMTLQMEGTDQKTGQKGGMMAGPLGAAAGSLPPDLGEETMLGDCGANALGALIGTAYSARTGIAGKLLALAVIGGLTAASEKVSFTTAIERTPALKAIDDLGRLKHAAPTAAPAVTAEPETQPEPEPKTQPKTPPGSPEPDRLSPAE